MRWPDGEQEAIKSLEASDDPNPATSAAVFHAIQLTANSLAANALKWELNDQSGVNVAVLAKYAEV